MPAEHLATGFYGKIPATGDFVSRGLPGDFVRSWDRWVATHLAPLQLSGAWPEHVGLRFILGADASGPMVGVALPGRDKAGRRFPLTVATPLPASVTAMAAASSSWFDAVEAVAEAALRGELGPDALGEALSAIPFEHSGVEGEGVHGMTFWTASSDLLTIDPSAPQAALAALAAGLVEAG
ncbi:MAG: type VI secretion-associated protein [Mesorhizobium sp. SCN 65-20]|mgnify:CR=1 FL=1|nr:MAG: type VI secretion-associated protein [Mesorhizobium sp. SCN 65-20]